MLIPRKRILASAVFAATLVTVAAPALLSTTAVMAQEAAKASATVDVGAMVGDAEPAILSILSVLIGGIVALIAWELKRLLGVTVNAKLTGLLHDALFRAATAGVEAAVTKSKGVQVDVKSAAMAEAITYMRTLRPKLVQHFGLDDAKLVTLLRTYLNKVLPADAQISA